MQPRVGAGRDRSGFTLIEILAVLFLITVLAAGVVSSIPDSRLVLPVEADRLSSHIRYTQIRAQSDVYQWRLAFTDTRTYEIGPVIIPGAGFTPTPIPGSSATQRTLPSGVTADADIVIRFDSWGRPLTDAGSLLSSDLSVTLTEGGESRQLTILAGTGLIR